jgi:hypothetical protein
MEYLIIYRSYASGLYVLESAMLWHSSLPTHNHCDTNMALTPLLRSTSYHTTAATLKILDIPVII